MSKFKVSIDVSKDLCKRCPPQSRMFTPEENGLYEFYLGPIMKTYKELQANKEVELIVTCDNIVIVE